MKEKKKRGFTIVELVIVIAVIAILAAVLIPTFSNVIRKAQTNVDIQVCKNLNELVAIAEAENGKPFVVMHDAVQVVLGGGYKVENLTPRHNKNDILWDTESGRFLLVSEGEIVYIDKDDYQPEDGTAYTKLEAGMNISDSAAKPYRFFKCYAEIPEAESAEAAKGYSIYAREEMNPEDGAVTVSVGFDAGFNTRITQVNYVHTGDAQDVVIRTNSFETLLVVSAKLDTVNHYGFAYIADVQKIASASFHEHGTVGRLKVAEGRAVVESTGTVFCAMETAETANIENNNGKIYTETTKDANNGNEHVTQKENGVFEAAYLDCGYGHHNMQKLVVDATHTYEVCTACGYTVKAAGVEAGAIVYHTSDDKTATARDPEVQVSASGEVTVDTTGATVPIVAGDVSNDIDVEKVNNCEHTFAYADEEGMCVGTCSKCGLKTSQEHHYWDLDGENVGEGAKCVQCAAEPISGVCKIGNTGYDTLKDAVAAVPTDGMATTIVMIANYGFTENVGVVISNGQNIVFDMNGFVLASDAPIAGNAALFTVKGKMTVKDSSDTNNNGTGKGKITTHIQNPDQAKVPGYASNTFYVNGGELILESGIVENYSWNEDWGCGASYCVDIGGWLDPAKDSMFTMNGGRLIGAYADQAVRVNNQTGTNCKCVFNMTGGVIESGGFWLQQGNNSSTPGEINISGGIVNGFIDLACFNKDEQKVTISGSAVINASGLRIRKWGNSHSSYTAAQTAGALTQTTDKFVFISCSQFNVDAFDSNSDKNYTQASEYKTFISIDDNTTLSGVATQLK